MIQNFVLKNFFKYTRSWSVYILMEFGFAFISGSKFRNIAIENCHLQLSGVADNESLLVCFFLKNRSVGQHFIEAFKILFRKYVGMAFLANVEADCRLRFFYLIVPLASPCAYFCPPPRHCDMFPSVHQGAVHWG